MLPRSRGGAPLSCFTRSAARTRRYLLQQLPALPDRPRLYVGADSALWVSRSHTCRPGASDYAASVAARGHRESQPVERASDLVGMALRVGYVRFTNASTCSAQYRLGGQTGPTSHNCPEWIGEVNRLALSLNLSITAAMSKTKRLRDDQGRSRAMRHSASTVPFSAIARFPYGVRMASAPHRRITQESRTRTTVTTGPN